MRNSIVPGNILISEPFLADPSFSRSVVLIVENEEHGTTGYVLNHPTSFLVNDIIDGIPLSEKVAYQGGPVELNSLHFIHNHGEINNALEVQSGVFWGGDFEEVCSGLSSAKWQLEDFKFFVGYSGWHTGQLDRELKEKAWLVGHLEAEYIFDESISPTDLWKHAIRDQGGKDALLANAPIDPFLN